MLRGDEQPYKGDRSPFGKPVVLDKKKIFIGYVEIDKNFLPTRKLSVGNPVVTTSPPFLVGVVEKIKTIKQGRGKKSKQVTKVWIDDPNETRTKVRNISCCLRPPVKHEYIRHQENKQWYQCISAEQQMMELRVVLMSPPNATAPNAPAPAPAASAPAPAPAPAGSDAANLGGADANAPAPAPDANTTTNDLRLVPDPTFLRLVSSNDTPAPRPNDDSVSVRAPAPAPPAVTNPRRATPSEPQRATDTYVSVCIHTILRVYIMRRYMHLCMYTQHIMVPSPLFFYACLPSFLLCMSALTGARKLAPCTKNNSRRAIRVPE